MTRILTLLISLIGFAIADEPDFKDITAAQTAKMMEAKKPPVIIDIRTLAEFKKGHIKGAKLIDFRKDFEANLSKLDRNQTYIFHCQSGGRSTQSLPVWKKLGFKNAYHLKSGYLGWLRISRSF